MKETDVSCDVDEKRKPDAGRVPHLGVRRTSYAGICCCGLRRATEERNDIN